MLEMLAMYWQRKFFGQSANLLQHFPFQLLVEHIPSVSREAGRIPRSPGRKDLGRGLSIFVEQSCVRTERLSMDSSVATIKQQIAVNWQLNLLAREQARSTATES